MGRTATEHSFDAAIEVGIAMFREAPRASDDELVATLEARGVAPWLARRLIVFLPVAFGRMLLAGSTLSDDLDDGASVRKLASDPVYAAAAARAPYATREEIEAIGYRSAEIGAANDALNRGSKLEDLVFSPVTLVTPLVPAEANDGGIASPRKMFAMLLEGHGHSVREEAGALATGALGFDARIFPRNGEGQVQLQADFTVRHPSLAVPFVTESFAGWGSTYREAIVPAVQKFERASLHVFIAGLLDPKSCADQVSWEPLAHPSGDFVLCMGAHLLLYSNEPARDVGALLDELKTALAAVELSSKVHALRLFTCFNGDEQLAAEALLDNERWPAGEQILRAHPWPRGEKLWGSRLFLLLTPAPAPA
jgi:hypothetical protein